MPDAGRAWWDVYVPARYVPGSAAPFLVFGDGGAAGAYPGRDLFAALDTLIEQHRLPPIVAIGIGAGGQDAQGSERGREYDAVSGTYAEWVEQQVLPLVERNAGVKLTKDPDGRAAMGISSSGAVAFTMAWFHPELYHRVLAYSPTMVNQQWPHDPQRPGGAWEYHDGWAGAQAGSPLIPNNPAKPIRFWFEVGDQDLFYPAANMPDGMHDWVLGDESMARVLAAKGYHYQFVFARGAGHVDPAVVAQTLRRRWSGCGRTILTGHSSVAASCCSKLRASALPVVISRSGQACAYCRNSRNKRSRIGRPLHCGCSTVVTMAPHSRTSSSSSFHIDSTCSFGKIGRGLNRAESPCVQSS